MCGRFKRQFHWMEDLWDWRIHRIAFYHSLRFSRGAALHTPVLYIKASGMNRPYAMIDKMLNWAGSVWIDVFLQGLWGLYTWWKTHCWKIDAEFEGVQFRRVGLSITRLMNFLKKRFIRLSIICSHHKNEEFWHTCPVVPWWKFVLPGATKHKSRCNRYDEL